MALTKPVLTRPPWRSEPRQRGPPERDAVLPFLGVLRAHAFTPPRRNGVRRLVDEPAGIRAGIRELDPSLHDLRVEQLLSLWQQHIDREQGRILDGVRPYVTSDVLDLEAARLVADAAGVDDPTAVAALALTDRRLPPWPDTVAGLA